MGENEKALVCVCVCVFGWKEPVVTVPGEQPTVCACNHALGAARPAAPTSSPTAPVSSEEINMATF